MIKDVFKGDKQMMEAKLHLKISIDSYNNALGNINLHIVIKVYELLKGTYIEHRPCNPIIKQNRHTRFDNRR
jgi:hypothetical protein